MINKYKRGEEITIREDLELFKYYGRYSMVEGMMRYLGKKAKIYSVIELSDSFAYELDIDEQSYNWSEDMFEDNKSKDNIYDEETLKLLMKLVNDECCDLQDSMQEKEELLAKLTAEIEDMRAERNKLINTYILLEKQLKGVI